MAIFPLIGCVIPLRTTWDKRVFFGVHLYQKDPKFVQKWLSYGHFPPQRLCDFIENYMWQKGILCCSIVPKWSKLGQELAELWPFSPWEVAWFHWEPHRTKGDPLVFICNKKIQNLSRNGWVMTIFTLRGCVIPLRTTWKKGGSLGFHLYQKDPKSVKKWLSYGHFHPERLRGSIENHMKQKKILWY